MDITHNIHYSQHSISYNWFYSNRINQKDCHISIYEVLHYRNI